MKRGWWLLIVWTVPSAVLLAVTAIVFSAYRIAPPARLDDGERTRVMATLRAALSDQDPPRCDVHRAAETVAVTVWSDGRTAIRVDGRGADLGAAVDAAAMLLRARPQIKTMPRITDARIQVDVIAGRAPLGDTEALMSALALPGVASLLALNPGVDGIGASMNDKTALVLPHELVMAKLLSMKRPSESMGDFAMGVDLDRIAAMVGGRVGARVERGALFRFRTDAFIEQPAPHRDLAPLQLYRGIPPAPKLSAEALRTAALAGAHYLVAHLAPNGRYVYEHDLTTGVKTDPTRPGAYSMPRHGGTTYFLAQVYRITKQEWLREPIERAFAHLVGLMKDGGCATKLPDGTDVDCVLDKGEHDAQLGSTALVVVALAEYELATGDTRYRELATKLTNWILFMQRPDGSFRHLYNPVTRVADDKSQLLYYSGEAALALTRMFIVTKDPRYVQAAERALDWLVGWYDFFMGGFIFGEEHWTCIAAEAIYPAVQKPAYREFCTAYGSFLRQQQPERGEHPDEDDLVGAYTVTPFVPPYNTPAGSRTEAMISAYLLGVHEGVPDDALRTQIEATLQYTIGQQIRPENDFDVIGDADGGMPGSPLERNVRIDYVQHVCSGMIRASEWPELAGQAH
jgi:hypothetical protein